MVYPKSWMLEDKFGTGKTPELFEKDDGLIV